MVRYDLRFWDTKNKVMIYGAGLSPNQLPVIQHENGSLEELQGVFVPMICTYQKATNGLIWEGDIIECDIPYLVVPDLPPTFIKARGVMQFNQVLGSFTINIASTPETKGQTFQVKNSTIIGCAISHPELLQIDQQNYENKNANKEESADSGNTTV